TRAVVLVAGIEFFEHDSLVGARRPDIPGDQVTHGMTRLKRSIPEIVSRSPFAQAARKPGPCGDNIRAIGPGARPGQAERGDDRAHLYVRPLSAVLFFCRSA